MEISSGGRPRSAVWQYFLYDETLNKSICQIQSCGIHVSGKFTTNLKRHLEKKHKDEFQIVEQAELQHKSKREKHRSESVSAKRKKDAKQGSLDDLLKRNAYGKDSKKYKTITRKLAICVATTNLPNSITDNEEFREFVEELNPLYTSMPKRTALDTEINKIHVEMQQKIKTLLSTAKKINLTADIWTKKGMSSSFLGVTAHMFSRNDHKRYTLTLAVRIFETPHTGNRILSLLKKILSDYEVDFNKIGVILTDNGSNMVKAFNADSLLNLDDEVSDDVGDEQVDVEFEDELMDDTLEHNIHSGDLQDATLPSADELCLVREYECNEEDHDLTFSGICHRLSCFSHSLQLVMSEYEKMHSLKKVVKKAQGLVAKCNKSVKVTEKLLKLCGKKLIASCPTRWSSSYLLIERLLDVKPYLAEVLTDLEWDNLQNSDYKALENICNLLEPFAKYTQLASAEEISTVSMIIPIIMELNMHLDEIKSRTSLSRASIILKDALNRRFSYIMNPCNVNQKFSSGIYCASTFLDLRYRDLLNEYQVKCATDFLLSSAASQSCEHEENIQRCDQAIEVNAHLTGITQRNTASDDADLTTLSGESSAACESSHSQEDPPQKKPRTFKHITSLLANKRKESNPAQTETVPIEREITLYHNQPMIDEEEAMNFEPLQFWILNETKFPILYSLAVDLLTIPASSAPSERVFSAAGIATSGRRNRLDKYHLEREVLLKKNKFVLNMQL